jgi:hypothetical protein
MDFLAASPTDQAIMLAIADEAYDALEIRGANSVGLGMGGKR